MRRVNLPDLPSWEAPKKWETIELQLKLITPMFGGGYKTREVDTIQPIRPAAIRGHLRHWWRATAGAKYASAEKLHEAEVALWGGASTNENSAYGKVALQVEIISRGQPAPLHEVAPKSTAKDGPLHGYFLFPYQEQKKLNLRAAEGRKDVVFKLRITMDATLSDALRQEVETALKAWIAFGGVGARTRRGCGALTVEGKESARWLSPTSPDIAEWLGMPRDAVKALPWTTLSGAQGIILQFTSATDAWRELGRFWARFRKGHFPQDYTPTSGGKWRDYRSVLCNLPDPPSTLSLAKPFLGLPIIYQDIEGAQHIDFTGTIEPADTGRMASPVILKPIALRDGKYGALVLVMRAPQPQKIRVNGEEYALQAPQDPLLEELNATDVLDAVLNGARNYFTNAREFNL